MNRVALTTVDLRKESQLVLARHRARAIAAHLHFDRQDQVRLATAVSEIARNALRYAGGGTVEFRLRQELGRDLFEIEVRDSGRGIPDLQAVLDGRQRSETGLGIGLPGTRRLVDTFQVESSEKGTRVRFGKWVPPAPPLPRAAEHIAFELARDAPADPLAEIAGQDRELLASLAELYHRQAELSNLNQELGETNRGVLALYAELDDRAREVQRIADIKSRFLSNITHEFRTPLNAILNLSRLLLEKTDGDLGPEQEKQVRYLHEAARDLVDLTNDLLDLAKAESGKIEVRIAPVDVQELFAALRGMLKPTLAPQAAVSLVFEDASGLPPIRTDERKLSQILRNLLSNALKYTEQGEVRVAARLAGDRMVFTVSDSGPGIAEEYHERIFEEFFQVEGAHQQRTKGTGLGLPLARKLAGLLGGLLGLRSAPGQGSVFFVELPARPERVRPASGDRQEGGTSAPAPAPPEPAENAVPAADVLVIDDDEPVRYLLRRMLETLSLAPREAADATEGLAAVAVREPDLVILDLVMPGLGGLELLRRLNDAVPVIVYSSKPLTPDEAAFLAKRAAAVIPKGDPGLHALIQAIRTTLARERRPPAGEGGFPR